MEVSSTFHVREIGSHVQAARACPSASHQATKRDILERPTSFFGHAFFLISKTEQSYSYTRIPVVLYASFVVGKVASSNSLGN
jgi:hypothetical protein